MKKFLFLSLLGLPVLFLWGCSLINNNDSWVNTWDLEKISQLEQQLSWLLEQFSWLQAENENLKETLSWSLVSIQTLQSENETLQADVDKYKKMIVEDKLNSKNTATTNNSSQDSKTNDKLQQNITRNRYNSSLWFSIMLPWKCFDDTTMQEWQQNPTYHRIQNLNYWSNNEKRVQCFIPDENNITNILELTIHNYECDTEHNQWQQVQFGNNSFMLYTISLLEWWEKKCYKTTYNSQTIRFSFSRWYDNNLIQEILESINNPI